MAPAQPVMFAMMRQLALALPEVTERAKRVEETAWQAQDNSRITQ